MFLNYLYRNVSSSLDECMQKKVSDIAKWTIPQLYIGSWNIIECNKNMQTFFIIYI